jgi:NUP50 (Nucleoporin 50 kDa)
MKRTADRQITKDDQGEGGGDSDAASPEGDNEGGDNYRASAEVMARRRIVRAKRNDDGSWKSKAESTAASATATSAGKDEGDGGTGAAPSNGETKMGPAAVQPPPAAANPFAGIQLVAPPAPATAVSATKGTQEEATKDESAAPSDAGATANEEGAAVVAAAEPPKKAASIFGSTSGFSGFGSVAKASGFSGFSTLPATTGGFGSATLAATTLALDGGASAANTSAFGSLTGFSGFAAAANGAGGGGGGFAFGEPLGTSADKSAATADDAASERSPSSKENTGIGEGERNGGADEASPQSNPSPPDKVAPNPKGPQLPTEYELVSGEESEKILMEQRCRTYRWGPQPVESDTAGSDSKAAAILSVPPSASSSAFSKDSAAAEEESSKESGDDKDPSPGPGSAQVDPNRQPACKWHEAGIGPLRILLNPESNRLRLVQRRESTINGPATKVVWNVNLWRESAVKPVGDRHVQISSFLGRGQPVLILCKCATPTNAAHLHALLESRVPNLRSAEATALKTSCSETTNTATETAPDVSGSAPQGDAS